MSNEETTNNMIIPEKEKSQKKGQQQQAKQPTIKEEEVPTGYIPVRFCTKGKLSAPPVLHFRNYTMEEAVELGSVREDTYQRTLLKVLNNLVWEDFDCKDLHEEEMKEVLLNIYYNFWGKSLHNMPFFYDSSLPINQRYDDSNIGYATVQIGQIEVDMLDRDDFKEPIKITDRWGNVIHFRLPRMADHIIAMDYVNDQFQNQEDKYHDVQLALRSSGTFDPYSMKNPSRVLEYYELAEQKEKEFGRVVELMNVLQVNDKELATIEEKRKAAQNDFDLTVWGTYRKAIQQLHFGVNHNVEVYDEQARENKVRRFQFRSVDFVPSMDSFEDTGNVVSFGD